MQAAEVPKEKLDQFIAITGADKGRAGFFLECANMDVAAAVEQYYSSDTGASTGINTLAGQNANQSDDSDNEGQQEFYAGGANKKHGGGSGIAVVGPNKKKAKKTNPDELVADMYEQARKAGGTEDDPTAGPSSFGGVYNSLSGQNNSRQVAEDKENEPITITLKLWENGFSVDEGETAGELRSYDDEDNKKFLDEIKSGYIPKELVNKHKNGKLHLEMEDHRDEPYKAPEKPKYIAYSGEGNTLGASTSNSSTSVTVEKDFQLNVKLSEPVTSIQIRLADGTREVQKFNKTHTVGDLRKVMASKSGKSTFKIMQAYPPKCLEDDSLTLEEAGLLNAAVMQR